MSVPLGNKAKVPNPALAFFNSVIGDWTCVGAHPLLPGVSLRGRASFEWLEGGAFVIMRAEIEHPQVPNGIAVFGSDDALGAHYMLYFDERKVSRWYDVTVLENGWEWSRLTAGFSQRYRATLSEDAQTIVGKGEYSNDGVTWEGDLELTYSRV